MNFAQLFTAWKTEIALESKKSVTYLPQGKSQSLVDLRQLPQTAQKSLKRRLPLFSGFPVIKTSSSVPCAGTVQHK